MEFTIKLGDYAPTDVIDALEEQLKFSRAGTIEKQKGEDEAYDKAKSILARYRPAD